MPEAEDVADREVVRAFRTSLAAGEEELLPAALVDRILDGESPLRVWREHRGLTTHALADRTGLAQAYVSQLRTGKRSGSLETLGKLATALAVTIDDLVPATA